MMTFITLCWPEGDLGDNMSIDDTSFKHLCYIDIQRTYVSSESIEKIYYSRIALPSAVLSKYWNAPPDQPPDR